MGVVTERWTPTTTFKATVFAKKQYHSTHAYFIQLREQSSAILKCWKNSKPATEHKGVSIGRAGSTLRYPAVNYGKEETSIGRFQRLLDSNFYLRSRNYEVLSRASPAVENRVLEFPVCLLAHFLTILKSKYHRLMTPEECFWPPANSELHLNLQLAA